MKTKELIKEMETWFLHFGYGNIKRTAIDEIIQRLREYAELRTILDEILDKLEEAYLVYREI